MKFDNIVAIFTIYTMHFEQYSNKKNNIQLQSAYPDNMMLLGQRWGNVVKLHCGPSLAQHVGQMLFVAQLR